MKNFEEGLQQLGDLSIEKLISQRDKLEIELQELEKGTQAYKVKFEQIKGFEKEVDEAKRTFNRIKVADNRLINRQEQALKELDEISYIARTKGFTKTVPETLYKDNYDASQAPSNEHGLTQKKYDSGTISKKSLSGKNIANLKKLKATQDINGNMDDYLVYDYETVGSQGNKNWNSTQFAFRGRVKGQKVNFGGFTTLDKESKLYLENLIKKAENGQNASKLTEIEKSHLLWLRDIKSGKNIAGEDVLTAYHHEQDLTQEINQTVLKEINNGFKLLTSNPSNFKNLFDFSEVKNELVKATNVKNIEELKKLTFVGHNISGFDNEMLSRMLGQNIEKYVDTLMVAKQMMKIGFGENGRFLSGYSASDITDFLGSNTGQEILTSFMEDNKAYIAQNLVKDLHTKQGLSLIHTALGDVVEEEKILKYLANQMSDNVQDGIFKKNKVYRAKSTLYRTNSDEGAFDFDGKALEVNNADYRKWNNRTLIKNRGYKIGDIKKSDNGRFMVKLEDMDLGGYSLITGGSEAELYDRISRAIDLSVEGLTEKQYKKTGNSVNIAIEELFNDPNLLTKLVSGQKITANKGKGIEKILKDNNIDVSSGVFREVFDALENIHLPNTKNSDVLKQIVLRNIGQKIGVSSVGYSASDISSYVNGMEGAKDFNSIKQNYRSLIKMLSYGMDKDIVNSLNKAVNELSPAKGDKGLYGIASMIENAITNNYSVSSMGYGNGKKAIEFANKNISEVASTIKTITKEYETHYATNSQSSIEALYKANKDSRVGKGLSGESKFTRFSKLGIKGANQPTIKGNFANHTLGQQLTSLEKIANSKGVGFLAKETMDGTGIELRMYNPVDSDSSHYASVVLPISDATGEMIYKGMRRADQMRMITTQDQIRMGTSSEEIVNSLQYILNSQNNVSTEGNQLVTSLLSGNYSEANRLLNWVVDKTFNSTSSLSTKKYLDELEQDELEKGNEYEKWVRSSSAVLNGGIERLIKLHGLDSLVSDNLSEKQIGDVLTHYITQSTLGYEEDFRKENYNHPVFQMLRQKGLINDSGNGMLQNFIKTLPQAQLESEKEMAYSGKRQINFGGAKDLTPGADINSSTKRAVTQVRHVLKRARQGLVVPKRQQFIVSGHSNAILNDLNTVDSSNYNVLGLNDKIIMQTIEQELANVDKNSDYYKELSRYKVNAPSVNESGILITSEALQSMEAFRDSVANLSDEDLDLVNPKFLKALGIDSIETLRNLKEGESINFGGMQFNGKAWGKREDGVYEKNKHSLSLEENDLLDFVERKNGKLSFSYQKFLGAKEGLKVLFGQGWRTTVNSIVSQRFMNALAKNMGYEQNDVDVATQQENLKKTTVTNVIAQYEKVISDYLLNGGTIEGLEQTIKGLKGAEGLQKYFTVDKENGRVKTYANRQKGVLYDRNGQIIFENDEQAQAFLSTNLQDLAQAFLDQGVQVNYNPNLYRTRAGLADEHQWRRAIGFDTYANVRENGPLKVDDKAINTIQRQINLLKQNPNYKGKSFEALETAWANYGSQEGIESFEKARAIEQQIKNSFIALKENGANLSAKDIFTITEDDLINYASESGKRDKKGTYSKEAWEDTAYGKAYTAAQKAGAKMIYLSSTDRMGIDFELGYSGKTINTSGGLYIPVLSPNYLNGEIMPSEFEGSFNKMISHLKNPVDGYEQEVARYARNLYTTLANNVYHKEGSVNQNINKKVAMAAMAGTAQGRNLEQEKLLGTINSSFDYSDIVVSRDNLKSMLSLSSELLNAKKGTQDYKLRKQALNNLGWLYENLMDGKKTVSWGKGLQQGEKGIEDQLNRVIEEIVDAVDINSTNYQGKRIGANLLRWPLTNDQGQLMVNLAVDDRIGTTNIQINSGQAMKMNADYDSDTIYAALGLLSGKYRTKADFDAAWGQQKEVIKAQAKQSEMLAKIQQAKYEKDLTETIAGSEEEQKAISKVAKFLVSGGPQDALETLMAKYNFSQIGKFSNVSTAMRNMFDDLGFGTQATNPEDRIKGTILNSFFEFFEQDVISAKKIQDRLSDDFEKKGINDYGSQKKTAIEHLNAVEKLYNVLTDSSYDGSDPEQVKAHWNSVMSIVQDNKLLKDAFEGRQLSIAGTSLKAFSGIDDTTIAKVLGENWFVEDNGVMNFSLSLDTIVNLLSEAEMKAQSSIPNLRRNLMGGRYAYLKGTKEYDISNIGSLIQNIYGFDAQKTHYFRENPVEQYNTQFLSAQLNTDKLENGDRNHLYTDVYGNPLKEDFSITEAGKKLFGEFQPKQTPEQIKILQDIIGQAKIALQGTRPDMFKEGVTNAGGTSENIGAWLQANKQVTMDYLRTTLFASERGTGVHAIFEELEKNPDIFEGNLTEKLQGLTAYQEIQSNYKEINKLSQLLTGQNIFDVGTTEKIGKDLQDVQNIVNLYSQYRNDFMKNGDLPVLSEFATAMRLTPTSNVTTDPRDTLLLSGTADGFTKRGVTDFKIKGKVGGLEETWQLNALWRVKKAQMLADIKEAGLTTDSILEKQKNGEDWFTAIKKLGVKSPALQKLIDSGRIEDYKDMLFNLAEGRDPLLTIKQFSQVNGKWVLSEHKFDEYDDETFNKLTQLLTLYKKDPTKSLYYQMQELNKYKNLNLKKSSESVSYDIDGKRYNPDKLSDLLFGIDTVEQAFELYNSSDDVTRSKLMKNTEFKRIFGLDNFKLSKKNVKQAWTNYLTNWGNVHSNDFDILKEFAINPDDSRWRELNSEEKEALSTQKAKEIIGNELFDYYKEIYNGTNTEKLFVGKKAEDGSIIKTLFKDTVENSKWVKATLNEKDLQMLREATLISHNHLNGSILPSLSDLEQLEKTIQIQREYAKDGKINLERFEIVAGNKIFAIDPQKIADFGEKFDWTTFKEILTGKELTDEELQKITTEGDFKDFFLGASTNQVLAQEVMNMQTVEKPQVYQNMVKALEKAGQGIEKSSEILTSKETTTKEKISATAFERAKILNPMLEQMFSGLRDRERTLQTTESKYQTEVADANKMRELSTKNSDYGFASPMVDNAQSIRIETLKKTIEAERPALEQDINSFNEMVKTLNDKSVAQENYQNNLQKAVKLQKELSLAEKGHGKIDNYDVKRKELEQLVDELRNDGKIGEVLSQDMISDPSKMHKMIKNMAQQEIRVDDKKHSDLLKEGVHDIEALQKMLSSGAPTQFTDSMAKAFENVATKVGENSDLQSGIQQIVGQMSDIQKIQMLQQVSDQFNATLAQDRAIANKQTALEQQTTRQTWRGETVDKTSVLNPWQNKMIQTQKTMLGIEASRVEAEQRNQMEMVSSDPNMKQQFEDRQKFNQQLKDLNKTYLETQKSAQRGAIGLQQFGHSFNGMIKTAFQYGVVYRGAQALIQQIYTIIGSIKEFDTLEAQIRMTKDVNKETAADMIGEYRKIADEYGTLTTAVAQSSITFLRQGRNVEDTNTLIKQSTTLAKVGFMEEAEAAELLTATLNGFNLEAKEAAEVVDLVAYTDTIAATSAQELMTAFQYVASSADVAGFEIEKLNAMIATSSETTRLSASTIGQAYKTMVSRLQQVKIGSLVDEETGEDISNMDKMLKQYGIDIMDINGKMKDGDVILEELSEKWKTWGNDTAKKREAVEALAGVRQGNIAMSLMDNWERYEEILSDTEANASGSSKSKMEAQMESINASVARLQNALHDISSTTWATGLYKWVVDLATGFVEWKEAIILVGGAMLLLKNNGAGLNAIYNIQAGLIERLTNSFHRLKDAQGFAQQQAQKQFLATNVGTISGGGLTAFVDPTTGAVSEPMDSKVAASTLAFNSESNLRQGLEKTGQTITEDFGMAMQGQEKLQAARINYAQFRANGITQYGITDDYAKNITGYLGTQRLAGNLNDNQRGLLMRAIGASAEGGFTNTQIDNILANRLGFSVEDGVMNLDATKLTEENVQAIEKGAKYRKEHIEALKTPQDNVNNSLQTFNKVLQQVTSSLGTLNDILNTNATSEANETKENIESATSENNEQLANELVKDSEITEDVANKNSQMSEQGETNASSVSTQTELEEASANRYSTQSEFQQGTMKQVSKGQQALSVGTSMLGMMGGSMLGTEIASSLGASGSTASMVGMLGGMGTSMLGMFGPWGMAAQALIGVGGMIFKGVKENQEKIKEELRKTFQEASEHLKEIQTLEDEISKNDWQTRFKELSQGVDVTGQNVSLSDEDYEEYRGYIDSLLAQFPELATTYNAEGEALIERNEILQKSIDLIKEQTKAEREKMYNDEQTELSLDEAQSDENKAIEGAKKSSMGTNVFKDSQEYKQMVQEKNKKDNSTWDENGKDFAGAVNKQFTLGVSADKLISMLRNNGVDAFANSVYATNPELVEELIYKQYKQYEQTVNPIYQETDKKVTQIYKNWASVQEGYDLLDTEGMEAIGQIITTRANKNWFNSDNFDDSQEKIKSFIKLFGDSKFKQLYNDYQQNKDIYNSDDNNTAIKGILDYMTENNFVSSNQEAFQLAKDLNLIHQKADETLERHEIANSKRQQLEKEVRQKMGRDEVYSDIELEAFSNQKLEEINNNWDTFVFKPIKGGFSDLKEAYDRWKQHIDDSFKEAINISTIKTTTDGIDSLMSATKTYRETTYTDETGKTHFVMSPETYENLMSVQKAFNLTDEQMDMALLNNTTGEWELLASNIEKLTDFILSNAFNGQEYSLEQIRMMDANFRNKGIVGAKELGYTDFLKQMVSKGKVEVNLDSSKSLTEQIQIVSGVDLGDKKDLYDEAIKTLDADKLNYLNTISNFSEVDTAIQTLQNLGRFGTNAGEAVELTGEQLTELTTQIRETTDALGGFSGFVNSLANSSLFTIGSASYDTLNSIMGSEGSADYDQLKALIEKTTGQSLGDVSAAELYVYANSAKEIAQANLQNRIDNYNKVNSEDRLKVGMADKEHRSALRSQRDLEQQLEDLNNEQKLDDVTLIIDKLQLSIDKLNKSMSTLGNIMDSIDAVDFAGKFDNINQQMSMANSIISTANSGWATLNEEYEKAAAEGNGEAMQKIGEQMASYSDNITDNSLKLLQLKKQVSNLLVESVSHEIEQIGDVANRELKILELQRSDIHSDKFNYFNTDLLTSPLNYLPNMEMSAIEKARNETNSIVTEENARQQRINEIKEKALQTIYDKAKAKREQDIKDTQEDLNDAIEQVSIAWQNKADANATYSRTALENQMTQFKNWLTEQEFVAYINTIITGGGDITKSGAQKVSDALYNNYNDGSGHSFAEMWKNPKEDFVASNSDWHKSGYYGDSFDQEQFNNDTERRYISNALYGTYAVPKDWTPGEEDSVKHIGKFREITKDGKLIFDYPTGESYSFTWDEFRHGQQVLRKGDQGDVKQVSSYADATPDTPISSGPITVAEHHPEFVKFKNGEGAIYDKTTILSGAEVDFVSDASYANGGKSNGTPVSAYAYGGNQSEAVETAKEVQENISESNENVVTNVEETNNKVLTNITDTNTEIEQNVTDNNKEISDTIETSWQDNEKTTNDSMWNIKDVTNTGLAEVVKTFAENMQELKDSVPQFVGNSNLVEIAQRFVGKQNTAGVFSGGRDEEWCADFISYIADLANISTSQLPRSASVATFYDFFEKNNQITNTPQVGDIVIVDKNQHIGIVTGVEEDGTVYTVSGNGGNKDNFKSTVHTATYTPEYIKKNNVSFGRMQGYDSGTIHTDVSNLGIVAEKQGEYIIDKKTGKPSYIEHDPQHPYDNIVDLSEYDVVSGEDSQAIRNKAYDKGTITSPNIKQTLTDIEKILEDIEDNTEVTAVSELGNDYDKVKDFIQQYTKPEMFVTEAFRRAQEQGEILRKKENENIFKQFKNSSGSILAVSQLQQYAENRRSQENWDVTIETNFKAITEYQNQLEKLNKLYLENKEYFDGHSEAYAALKEQFDNINQQIETFNSNLQQLTEQMVEEHARQTKIAMASIDTVYARMSKRLEEINNQINTLNDWESLTKLGEVLKLANATTNKKQTVDNQKTEYERIIKEQENIIQDILLGNMGLALKAQNSTEYKKIMDSILMADGQINVATNNAIMNLAEIYKTSKGDELSGSDAQLLEELMLALGIIKTTGPELAQKESEALQLEQEQFNIANQILEVSKQYLQQEYENRQSLFKAVIENTNSIKELTEMSGQLISDVNYREKAENFVEKYNASLKNVEAYRKRDDNLHLEREKQERYFYRHNGINLTKGFTAKGELIAGSTLAENYQEWKEALQDAIANRNEDEIAELTEKINGVDMYGQTLVDLNENQQSLQSALVNVVEQQKELIEQGQKYLEQYMEEMISQYKANTDTNSLINDKLSVIRDALSDFNRDEQLLIINGQLRNNANERVNLIEQQFAIKEEREALIRSSEAVVGISMDSLFTSKGEKNTSAYNEALQTVEDLYRSGSIREDEYITWQTNVEKVGEWKKQELELEEQILDNYQNENKFLEEKISLIKESYDWQITKMSSLLELTNKRFDTENKIFELRHELDKELRSAKQSMQWLTKSERLKIFNEEDYAQLYQALDEMDVKTQSYYDDYYNQMMNLTEETLYQQEYITAEYERRMELVEAEYAITQKRVDLEKEQLKLKNVASEKSERMYVNGQWIQVANTEELISASDAVADAEKELELAQQEKLQKTQEIQMNEYIDSLKKIQAALENSTKATSKTEEELIGRLTQTIESLIGSGSTKGALNVVIDNLTTDLHNYEQITKTIINDELKEAVSTLSQVTTGLQTEITKQQEVLLDDRKQISDTIGYFNKKVNAVNTETLIDNLDELGDEILKVIGQLQGIDQNEGNRITYNQEAYDIMNDIAWNKKEWNNPNATEKYKTSLHEQNVEWFNQLSDMGFDKQVFLLKHLDGIEAEKFKNELKKYNASEWDNVTQRWLTNKGISGSGMSQYDIENLLGYINEIAWAKDEYTKAEANGNTNTMDWATNYADYIRHKVEKLELKGLEKQATSWLKNLSYQQTIDFKTQLAANKDNAEQIINKWATIAEQNQQQSQIAIEATVGEAEAIVDIARENDAQYIKSQQIIIDLQQKNTSKFTLGTEQYSLTVDKEKGIVELADSTGVQFNGTVDNFGTFVDNLDDSLKQLVPELERVLNSANSTEKQNTTDNTNTSNTSNSSGGSSGSRNTSNLRLTGYTANFGIGNVTVGVDTTGLPEGTTIRNSSGNAVGTVKNGKVTIINKASGTKSAEQGIYNLDEIGKEIVIPSGRLRMMEYGDQVIPHNISENLLKWGTLNPALLRSLAMPEHTNNITTTNSTEINIDTIKLDNVTNGSNFLPELNRYMKRTNSLL